MTPNTDSVHHASCNRTQQQAYLVGKADTSTKADTANDEHGQILGKGTQNGTNTEGSTTTDHNQLPAANLGNWAGKECEESACIRSTLVSQ